jgi:ankyrin repeat protein
VCVQAGKPSPWPLVTKPTGGVSLVPYLDLTKLPHGSFFDQSPFIPRSIEERRSCTTNTTFDLLGVNTYLETLQLFVMVISNNFDIEQIDKLFTWLSEDKTAQDIVIRLLRQNLVSMKACAEKLLFPAVEHRNRAFTSLLIGLGADLNIYLPYFRYCTALQCAVEKQYPEIVHLLLEHGANDWRADRGDNPDITLLDRVVELGDVKMLERLLDCELRVLGTYCSASEKTFYLAASKNRMDLVTLLADRRPEIWKSARKEPWLLFEAAALCEGTAMVDALVKAGLDIKASDSGCGSPLAVASAMGNVELVQYLILAGVDVHTVNVANNIRLGNRYNTAALHMAIGKEDAKIVRMLLENGADPNQCCAGYPIQYAASYNNHEIVGILLDFGARVDATSHTQFSNSSVIDTRSVAIRIALEKGHLDVVQALHNAGAKVPLLKTGRIRHSCRHQSYDCPLIHHNDTIYEDWIIPDSDDDDFKDDVEIHLSAWWDPWVVAIITYPVPDLQRIVSKKLIPGPVLTAHISHCIIIHGASFTQELFQCDLLSADLVEDPLILCALVHAGDVETVKKTVSRLVTLLGSSAFVQQYGIKALILAVSRDDRSLIQILLKNGVDPFAPEPGVNEDDLWRFDHWYPLRYFATNPPRPLDILPTEWVLHPMCSTAFQTAVLTKNMEIIDCFLAWGKGDTFLMSNQNRKRQLSAAYVLSVCSGSEALENIFLQCGITMADAKSTLNISIVEQQLHIGLRHATHFHLYQPIMRPTQFQLSHRLLDMGAAPDLDIPNPSRNLYFPFELEPPLVAAVRNQEIDLVKRLLAIRADVHAILPPHFEGSATGVQIAAMNGNFDILELLLQAGGDLNAPPGFDGRTALEGAAEQGRLDMTIYLLSQGADVKGRNNKNYRRAVYRAWKEGHRVLAKMVQEWKMEHYGEDDCDTIEETLASVTLDELYYWDDKQRELVESRRRSRRRYDV